MLFAMYILKDRKAKLENLVKNIKDDHIDLKNEKAKFYGFVYDLKLAINEINICCKDSRCNFLNDVIFITINNVRAATDGITMKNALNTLIYNLEGIDTGASINSWYGNFNKINTRIIQFLMTNIHVNRPFTIFDPQCMDGYLLNEAKNTNKNARLYGLEENNVSAEAAKKVADKIIKGKLKGSRISNDAFDIVYCLCHIKTSLEENMSIGAISKEEKKHIMNMLKYLRNDGLIMIAIPYYRMHKDICTLIARQLKNVSIVKGMGDDENPGLIYIIGQKCKSKEVNEEIYESLRKCYNYGTVKYIHEITLPIYTLPASTNVIDLFKGSILDTDELLNIVKTSGCIDAFFNKQQVKKIHENTIKPLLPFNVGQIGLVLTSGCLDGIIDEGDNHFHLVKGRVSKKKDIERTVSNGVVEETETISNRVEINVILPNGDFKTLA